MNKIALFFVVLVSLAYIAGCTAPAQSAVKPETTPIPTQEAQVSAIVPAPNESTPGLQASEDPYWEVDSLDALDELMSNADGYAYYYIFEKVPENLRIIRVGMPSEMDHYNITFLNSENEEVQLFVFSIYKMELDNFDTMSVDGVTYYYSQELVSPEGEKYDSDQMVAYFQWIQDSKVILVHPKEPITKDVIRKYNKLIRVEFNKGKQQVGMDTGEALIKDIDKITALIRSNSEIHYHTGVITGNNTDDLLR
jgi:hypothetical protein